MNGPIIITGGNGFVGHHLIAELVREWQGIKLAVWDRNVQGLASNVEGVAIDITDPSTYEESLRQLQPSWIIHLAAFSAVGESFKNPDLVKRVNVEATRKLYESIGLHSPNTKVLAISSADIYGKGSATPLPELSLDEARPRSPYAESKLEMERMIENEFNDRTIRVRPFPHIGPGQRTGFVTSDFASQIAVIEAGKQEAIMRVGNLEAQRDFTDVRDVVRAYRLLLEKGETGQVYHVASGRAVSIKNILDQLISLAKVSISYEQDPARMRPSDMPISVGSFEKLNSATGWQPTIALDQSLRDVLDWWRSSSR